MGRGGWIEIDGHQVRELEVDISKAPSRLQRGASEATVKGLRRITKEMKVDAAGHRYLPRFAKSPDYQLVTPLMGEAGHRPHNSKQGSLAHILWYGSINNAPIGDYLAGPMRALPGVEEDYADAAEKAVLGERA